MNAHENQPIWVDVFIPKGTVAGNYTGIITVSANREKSVQIAVQLTVWNITLPDTPSLRSNFGKLDANIAKARAILGYHPATTPDEGLAAEVRWYRDEFCDATARTAGG